jgi:hypothetical protein
MTEEKHFVNQLLTYGEDGLKIPLKKLPESIDRACLIVCNTYTNPKLALGTGPLNDAINVAKMSKYKHLVMYLLYNPKKKQFLEYMDKFLQISQSHLLLYYVGHGANIKDQDGDEDDGFDEAFVFDDGYIIDDILLEHLIKYKNPNCQLTLLTDACHSGSIWDIQSGQQQKKSLPPNIISISASEDSETAKQTVIQQLEEGLFTHNFHKLIKNNHKMTPNQMKAELDKILKRCKQTVTIAATSPEICDHPFFS